MSCTTHRRAANPPPSVIQAGRRSNLRASRFLVAGIPSAPQDGSHLLPRGFKNRCKWYGITGVLRGYFEVGERAIGPKKAGFPVPCRPRQRPLYVCPAAGGGRGQVCSLRLSVRTPPFHGGESGSIPLGSATASEKRLLQKGCSLQLANSHSLGNGMGSCLTNACNSTAPGFLRTSIHSVASAPTRPAFT